MALLIYKTSYMVEMITTNDQTPHTVVTTTRTNVHEIIAADRHREIAPTPTRAAHVITTEMVQHSTKIKRSTREPTKIPRFVQHHRKSSNTCPVTQPKQHSSEITRKYETIKRKDKINKTP
jgi:hypothetical protein